MTVMYYLTLCLPLATILIVFAMRYGAIVQQAKAKLANEGAYRDLAEKSAVSATETAAALADIRGRLAAVEKILKDVE